jgi:endonuclease/exonuclease/phosphatase family metal-dependent hydrolase
VAGRAEQCQDQCDAVIQRAPDILALQEISPKTYSLWRAGLLRAGYSVVGAVDLARLPYPPPPYPERIKQRPIHRKNFNLTAARHPIAPLRGLRFEDPDHARLAFPEKFVAAEVSFDGRLVEVHNAHAPPGSTRYVLKPQALAAVRRRIDERPQAPQILRGDFNTRQRRSKASPSERGLTATPRFRTCGMTPSEGSLNTPGYAMPTSKFIRPASRGRSLTASETAGSRSVATTTSTSASTLRSSPAAI